MPRKVQKYGWKPDLPDHRDHLYAAPPAVLLALPSSIDLRSQCPAVYDQSDLGSCTANGIGAAIEFDQIKEKLPHVWVPSRLFIYYNERVIEGSVKIDAGAQIRDGIKSVVAQGICSEELWKYDITKFAKKPPAKCYTNAKTHLVTSYMRVTQTLSQMKGCLAAGFPFIFGFSVYESFESQEVARTGILNMPGPKEQMIGGHAVICVGYDDKTQRFLIRNSWGSSWGMSGYFTIPYSYLTDHNLADDFWTIRFVQGTKTS